MIKKLGLALLVFVAGCASVCAGPLYDLRLNASSATLKVGYTGVVPATDAVLVSSGAVVFQSTSATSGHKLFRARNNGGTEVLSITQGGTTAGTFSGNITGNVTGNVTGAVTGNATTATALAANGTNCSPGNYPLGVDASGNSESCTAVGAGDAVLASTQTWTGSNTFKSTMNVGVAAAPSVVFTTTVTYAAVIKGGRTEVAIASFTAVNAIMFTNLNSSYTHHLELRLMQNGSNGGIYLRYNGSTGTGYRWAFHRALDDATTEGEGSTGDTECQVTGTSLIRATDNAFAELTFAKVVPSFGDKMRLWGVGGFVLSANNETSFRVSCLYEPSGAALNTISVTVFPSAGTWTGVVRLWVDVPSVTF